MFKLITFPGPGGADANQEADLVPFVALGEVALAVVLRLSSDLPRIRVLAHLNSSEGDRGDGLA
ncbi:hypothetical protein FA04_14655 [Ensifer adhaerens]|nr:hypothetical protein FA04_14655 [Ensifer adhaerens]KDP70287.1 hypothetical protein FA04_29050 [Ensifer adhaerens]